MNDLAAELNTLLGETLSRRFFSGAGRRLRVPKGIAAQSAEAEKPGYAAHPVIGPPGMPVPVPGLSAGIFDTVDRFFDEGAFSIASYPCRNTYEAQALKKAGRCGRGRGAECCGAPEKKHPGAVRSSVSRANTSAGERQACYARPKSRCEEVKRFANGVPANPRVQPRPFHSGWFMRFRCTGASACAPGREPADKHGIGVIAFGGEFPRIAFAGLGAELVPAVYQTICQAASGLQP